MLRRQSPLDDDDRVLVGCTLPPKVAGIPRGAVLLSVPHVLPSVTADAVAERTSSVPLLPYAPLVRVRWWGEDRPGSTLFRPTLISHGHEETKDDEEDEIGDSSIRMRYPVCVPLGQFIDYLRDMNELVLDVVDHTTRKKIGRSVFSFSVDASTGVDVEDIAKSLRRTNALCEIHSTVDDQVMLGYLTVNFEIEWTTISDVSTPLKWTNNTSPLPTISMNPRQPLHVMEYEPERTAQQRLSFSNISSLSTTSSAHPQPSWRRHESKERPGASNDDSDSLVPVVKGGRLDGLLEKGRALERSMSKAVTDESVVIASNDRVVDHADSAPIPVSMMMMMAPYEAMTAELDDSWEHVLEEADMTQPPTNRVRESVVSAQQTPKDGGVSLGHYDALEISFESMELEQDMMDRLRQLREGSVSTRFSPIQLVVSHEHPQCLLQLATSSKGDHWIAAFAVNSSLRKRQWRTNYTHTLPLLPEGSSQSDNQPHRVQLTRHSLRFRVRCKPQDASPTGRRRRGLTQSIDLCSEIVAEELFDHQDREWVLSLPLRFNQDTSKMKNDRSTTKRSAVVGKITVKFQFCRMPELSEDGRDEEIDGGDLSQWSQAEPEYKRSKRHRDYKPVSDSSRYIRHILPDRRRRSWAELGTPLFFGLLIDRALVTTINDQTAVKGDSRRHERSKFSVRIEYGTPAFFGRSAKALRLKRSAKATLHLIEHDRMRANLRHMNAFPLDVSTDFVQKLKRGLLILEVWFQEQSKFLASFVTEKLLGVVKIPLHAFVRCISDIDTINNCLLHPTPFVGVDQDFPIVDPLDDQVNGRIHVRMAFGSVEQMFNLKSTLTAVVKLQSLVRGWLTRRALSYWRRFELTEVDDEHEEAHSSDHGSLRSIQTDLDASAKKSGHHSSSQHGDAEVELQNHDHLNRRIVRVEIRVEVREKYTRAPSHDGHVIGCEVFGHLRFNVEGGALLSSSSAGPRFTLWWDANDVRLNSYFVHTLEASNLATGIILRDVVLLFRVEPQLSAGAERSQANPEAGPKGVAAIDLSSVASGALSNDERDDEVSKVVHMLKAIDVPIEWEQKGDGFRLPNLTATLPLRLVLQITHEDTRDINPPHTSNGLTHEEERSESFNDHTNEVTSSKTLSRTERLLPASLHLCIDIQRIADLKDMIQAQLTMLNRQSDGQFTANTMRRAFERGHLKMAIVMSMCLGTDLHPDERLREGDGIVIQDDHGWWHKRLRFDDIELEVVNEMQMLPSITQGDAWVMVHPELVSYLQDGSLDVEIFVCDEEGDVPAGIVSIPLSAILFRPSGVQGSFSVRADSVLTGRVGVHMYIDQDEEPSSSVSNVSTDHHKESEHNIGDPEMTSTHLASPSPLPEIHAEGSHEQSFEQAVASIHAAAQQIQHRLARLTAQSIATDTELLDDRLSEELSAKDSDDGLATTLNTSPRTYPATSTSTRINEVESNPEESTPDLKNSLMIFDTATVPQREQSESSGEQIPSVEMDDDFNPFQPITLASLGINEGEFSPITSPNSPMSNGEDYSLETRGSDSVSSTPTHAQSSLPIRDVEDVSLARIEADVDQKWDDDDECDGRDLPISSVTQPEGSQGDEAVDDPSHDEPPISTVPSEHKSDDEGYVRVEFEASDYQDVTAKLGLDGSLSVVDSVSIMSAEPASSSSTSHPEPLLEEVDVHGHVFSDERTSEGNQLDIVCCLSDSHETTEQNTAEEPTRTVLHEDAMTSSEFADHNESHPEVTSDNHAKGGLGTTADKSDCSGVSNTVEEGEGFADLPVPPLVPTHNEQIPVRYDRYTQTGDDGDLDVVGSQLTRPCTEQGVQVEESHLLVDQECQTQLEEAHESEDGNQVPSGVVDSEEGEEKEQIPQVTSTTNELSQERLIATSDANSAHVDDVHGALPVEKFKIAWQLLNEIRALYVDPNGQELVVSSPQTQEFSAAQEGPGIAISQPVNNGLDLFSTTNHHNEIVMASPNESTEGADEIKTYGQTLITESSQPWQWRDAASLRADMEARLQANKREYEEALALSQSISSMKSWSNASQLSTKHATQWEEKAQELSSSALAKRREGVRARTLFREDTETERIARIMQGSLRHWLPEDDDEGDTSEDDAEFVDNYF